MTAWSVFLEHRVAGGIGEDALDRVMEEVEPYGGVAVAGGDRVGIRVSVEAGDVRRAVEAGAQVTAGALVKAGVKGSEAVRLEASTMEDLERENGEPTFPDVVGSSEVADMLGVSRQRLHQLRHDPTLRFPEPMVELAATPLWLRSAIVGFLERWPRLQGAPGHRTAVANGAA